MTTMTATPIRILLADDHTVMRNGLRLLLERQPNLKVVGEAADGREAVTLAAAEEPDVVVMDIAMPHLNGVEAARQIVANNPHRRWSSSACTATRATSSGRSRPVHAPTC